MENKSNPIEPFVFNKYLVSLTKIVAFYCFFFVLIKSIAIVRGAWLLPNIIVTLPLIIMGIWSAYTSYFQKYNWFTAVTGAIVIVAMRYFESGLVFYLHDNL
uniref:hypothetical protein n=1 Tax=Flavobacterium sp. TaxID=239 RepID=UPI00404AEFC7